MIKQLNVVVRRLDVRKMVLMALMTFGFIATANAETPRSPVGKLMDPNGTVEYSRDGEKWRPVTRAKYLFSGYHVRTGADGSGNFINQESGLAQSLSANVTAMVGDAGLDVSAGEVSDPFSSDAGLMDGLANKFASAQRYTTVRRAVKKPGEPECEAKVRLARNITVSEGYADLVWEKACPDNTFVVVLGEQAFEVPSSATGEHIRFQLPLPAAGEYDLRLDVKAGDEVVYTPRRPGKLKVLAAAEEALIKASLIAAGDDFFAQADVLEQHGLLVPAMDAYRAYFETYPDDIEMKPLFIANLSALRLMTEKTAEAQKYNDFIAE
ncbi:MAG: hypothetical protein P8N63_04000 [Pseudomonadales bacterium]|nr:hypothetical protein [Pseudomonadales bacterium]